MLAGILANKYIGGPDIRMGEEEMAWVETAAAEMGTAMRSRQRNPTMGFAS